jgi:hypothetical protein
MTEPVYILIRTSGRPNFFKKMWKSIEDQTYSNIITITHTDDPKDTYVKGDIIIKSKRNPKLGRGHYNLYCNKLLKAIPGNKGWFHIIDDDDQYAAPDVIERLVKLSKKGHVNVGRSDRGNNNIWPKYWKGQKSFQTECFFVETKNRFLGTWWHKRAGDHHYSKQLTKKLPINWIDNLLICTTNGGKGRGERKDLL